MGNLLACGAPIRVHTSVGSMKPCSFAQLVLSDGRIEHMTMPVSVAELMLEHPQHFVCHVNQDGDFERDRALPADAELESGEIYYLRSKAGFSSKSPLRQLKRSASASSAKDGGVFQQAFRMMQKGPVTQVVVSADCVARLLSRHGEVAGEESEKSEEEQLKKVVFRLTAEDLDNPEVQMAYQMRLVSRSVSWKPKLATIEES